MIESARAAELSTLLERAAPECRILSLDCFDTLIWRNAHAPIDIFAELDGPGGAVMERRFAEDAARAERRQRDGLTEVTIEAIAEHRLPAGAEQDAVTALVEAELAAEARHCFAFAPTVALIRAARTRGLTVILVSDTYLAEAQLRALIAAVAGADVSAMIDRIFCSCEHGRAKADGLFTTVLRELGVPPSAILHVGDNRGADVDAPARHAVPAVHFAQFDAAAEQQLRFEAAAAAMIDPATRITLPTMQPHRAALSLRPPADPATLLGHDVFGPIMLGFARWIRDEVAALAGATGRRVRPLFLLRDGHLPRLAYQAAGFGDAGAIELSRFTARRASLTDEAAIRRFLAEEPTTQVYVLGRQLLLDEEEIGRLGSSERLRMAVVQPKWVAKIVERSRRFADRLVTHVRHYGGIEPGDVLMFVDLGYNGTVQNLAGDILAERLDALIVGRYLLFREGRPSGRDKKGLIDARHYDHRVLGALSRQVAPLEQISTAPQASVIDYRIDGAPIRRTGDTKVAQIAIREAVQQACLDYPATEARAKHRPAASDGPDADRRMVAASLARLLFLPRDDEVALLRTFDHDVNLGTRETVRLIDDEAAATGLRQRGIGYLAGVERMFVSGELQRHGLPLTLSLFAVGSLGLDLRQSDFQAGGIEVPVLIVGTSEHFVQSYSAYPTHEGYYLLTVPVAPRAFAVGIQFGQFAEVIQISSIGVHSARDFAEAGGAIAAIPIAPLLDGMERIADGLHRCLPSGLLFVPPIATEIGEPLLLAIVFRPVVERETTVALSEASRRAAETQANATPSTSTQSSPA